MIERIAEQFYSVEVIGLVSQFVDTKAGDSWLW